MYAQLAQILNKIQRDQKTQLPPLKSQEQKQGTAHAPCTQHNTKGWPNHLSQPSSWTPGHTPILTPYKEPARPCWGVSKQGILACFHSPLLQ